MSEAAHKALTAFVCASSTCLWVLAWPYLSDARFLEHLGEDGPFAMLVPTPLLDAVVRTAGRVFGSRFMRALPLVNPLRALPPLLLAVVLSFPAWVAAVYFMLLGPTPSSRPVSPNRKESSAENKSASMSPTESLTAVGMRRPSRTGSSSSHGSATGLWGSQSDWEEQRRNSMLDMPPPWQPQDSPSSSSSMSGRGVRQHLSFSSHGSGVGSANTSGRSNSSRSGSQAQDTSSLNLGSSSMSSSASAAAAAAQVAFGQFRSPETLNESGHSSDSETSTVILKDTDGPSTADVLATPGSQGSGRTGQDAFTPVRLTMDSPRGNGNTLATENKPNSNVFVSPRKFYW